MSEPYSWQETAGVRVLRFPHLERAGGVRALFTSRRGGVSGPPWESLNLSYSVGDGADRVAENRRRAAGVLGVPLSRTVVAGLVHGNEVARVDGPTRQPEHWAAHGDGAGLVEGVDALVTATPALALLVTTADCVPVWLYDPDRRVVGMVHAGWRGTIKAAGRRAVERMQAEWGCDPARMLAVVGPAIGPCCYEVDEPVRSALGPERAHWLRPGARPDRWQLDLWSANREQLVDAGLPPPAVAVAGLCTACRTDLFYSHRAEGGRTGRQAGLIALVD